MRAHLVDFMKRPAVVTAASVLILRGLTLSSRFLLSVLLARMLSPDEMGQYGLITAVLAFALLALVWNSIPTPCANWCRHLRRGGRRSLPIRSRSEP